MTERSVLIGLVFYCKGMLEKVTMQRTQPSNSQLFRCYRKKRQKKPANFSSFVVSQQNAEWIERGNAFSEIRLSESREPLIKISRDLERRHFK